MENLVELKQKLHHLAEQLEQKSDLSDDAFMTEEEYLDYNLTVKKPVKRSVSNSEAVEIDCLLKKEQVQKAQKSATFKHIAGMVLLGGEALLAIISWVIPNVFFMIKGIFDFSLLISSAVPLALTLPFFIIALSLYKNGKREKQDIINQLKDMENSRIEAKRLDEENERYNRNEYPSLLETYNAEVGRLIPLYIQTRDEAQLKLDELNAQMAREEAVLAEKYHPYVRDIIEIIEDGRASTLAEAINVLIADQNAERLLAEQMRQTRIQEEAAKRQYRESQARQRELERHNREMEANAAEQLRLQRKQTELAKCHNCASEDHCSKQICTGYRPKK